MSDHPSWCDATRCTVEHHRSTERIEHRSQTVGCAFGQLRALAWLAQEPGGEAEVRVAAAWPNMGCGATGTLPLQLAADFGRALCQLDAEARHG